MPNSRLPMPSEIIEIMRSNYAKAEYTYSEQDPTVITGIRLLDSTREGSTLKIPNGITAINAGLPVDHILKSRLKSIIFPNSITSIGNYAFSRCRNVESLELPNSITSIGEYVFSTYENLKTLKLPNSITSISMGTFKDCTRLESLIIPDSVTTINYRAFYGCGSLASLIIPKTVTNIGKEAFRTTRYTTDNLNVYYSGTEEEWNNIAVGTDYGLDPRTSYIIIHYNSTGPES